MKKLFKMAIAMSLCLAISGTTAVYSQTTNGNGMESGVSTDHDNDNDNDDSNYGWIGLIGLAGLLGLRKRDNDHRHDHKTN